MKNLGVTKGTVKLSNHQTQWTDDFENEKESLLDIFGQICLDIQHIGSTAIPNLIAKPLIDITVKVTDIDNLDQITTELNKIGYTEKVGRLLGRQKVFAKSKNSVITHHLHIIEKGNPDWDYKVKFREILLKHPKVLEEYAELKKTLSAKFKNERPRYTAGKSQFIKSILAKYS